MHTVKIVFGKELVDKYCAGLPMTLEEEANIKEYSFQTLEEKDAFTLGVSEAVGWVECYIVDEVMG